MKITRRQGLALSASIGLTGCGMFGSSPTGLKLTITAGAQLNPGPAGNPAPLAFRFFELAGIDAFGTASFAALFYNPSDTLRSDLINSFTLEVTPSSTVNVTRTLDDQTRYLGIVAGYRDIGNATWRLTKKINVHGSNRVRLLAGQLAISYAPPGGWF
jgi:type VI secretion system protein VasD